MSEAALVRKRKIVEIPLPSLSWKSLFCAKGLLFFMGVGFLSLAAYWYWMIYPFLWVEGGRVEAVASHIRSNETGTLAQIVVQEGDEIQKGQSLFFLENEGMFREAMNIQNSLVELKEQSEIYKKQAEKAMQDYLSALGVLTQEESDFHLHLLQEAQSNVDELALGISSLENESNALKLRMDKLNAVAPFDGVVVKQGKAIGDIVHSGEPILSLFDLNRSWIEVCIPEENLHLIQIGQKTKIRLAAYPKREWSGAVSWIGPATVSKIAGISDQGGEKIPIKISFQRESFPLKPGLSAEVGIRVH